MNKGQKLSRIDIRVKIMSILILTLLCYSTHAQHIVVKSNTSVDRHDDGKGVVAIRHSTGKNSFNIEYKGEIATTDDDKDIKSISPGGYLEISKTTFGSKRSIQIEATSNGLKREYYEGRSEVNYLPEGKKWLAEILPEVIRTTGIGAKNRVTRFYKKGGVDAVLAEINVIESDYVKSVYGGHLLEMNNLSDNDLIKVAEGISSQIGSDYYLSEVLRKNSKQFLIKDNTSTAYFNAVKHVGSDYYSTVILKEALKEHKPSKVAVIKIMDASKNIGSDYYQMTVLNDLLDDDLDPEALKAVVATSRNISSDYYQTQLLSKALEKPNLPDESFVVVVDAMANVNSDYYMASVFSKMLDKPQTEATNMKIVSLMNSKLRSDYYTSTVLSKMIKNQELSDKTMESIADALQHLGSSNYAASVIKNASEQNLSKKSILSLIQTSGRIGSDYYASVALSSLASQVKRSNDKDLKEAYRAAAKNIHSDTYYGRAMRAID